MWDAGCDDLHARRVDRAAPRAARRLSERANPVPPVSAPKYALADAGRWLSVSMITERPAQGRSPGLREAAPRAAAPGARRDVRAVLRAYVSLTKPQIVELLLVTTIPAMMFAAGGWPDLADALYGPLATWREQHIQVTAHEGGPQ